MGHVIMPGIGTASLDTFGGLITEANPSDLPEGASPRTWDTDFLIGSVFTRAGLAPVYSFASTLSINSVVIHYNTATIAYAGKDPVINEGFILEGFTGNASFLNGLTVTVETVDLVGHSFTAVVVAPDGTYTGLDGSAVSTIGNFIGPNVGGSATVVSSGGSPWVNQNNILGSTAYATSTTGNAVTQSEVPGSAVDDSAIAWSNPSNILSSTLGTNATVSLSAGQAAVILASAMSYNLPADAIVTGVAVAVSAASSGAAGTSSLQLQLATNGNPIGTPINVPISGTRDTYFRGSPAYQWGTVLTPSVVNGAPFDVLIQASQSSGTALFSVNSLLVTVYYTTASSSEALNVNSFNFVVPATSGVSGFGATFQAFSSAATTVTLQLLKFSINGPIPVGTPVSQVLTTVPTVYSLGSPLDLFGSLWLYSDISAPEFGVQITTSGLGTTSINDLDMLVYITPGLSNFNYIKSYIQDNGQTDTLALDASGIMWIEDVTNLPGILSVSLTGILPGSYGKSATSDDREYIMLSNLAVGTDRPRTFDGTKYDPLSQVGPGAPPSFVGASGASGGSQLTITSYSITSNVVTYTFDVGPTVSQDQIYSISGAVPTFLNIVGVVLGTPPPTGTTFSMDLPQPEADGTGTFSPSALGVLQFNYPITSITQNLQHPTNGTNNGGIFWGAGPGPTHTPGSSLVIYYSETEDTVLDTYFAANPTSTYVYLGSLNNFPQFSNQTYLVTAVGNAKPSSTAGATRFYFVVNVGVSGSSYPNGSTGTYQMTIATVLTSAAIPGLVSGSTIQITGETPAQWNNTWTVVQTVGATLSINSTQMSAGGTATYGYSVPVGGNAPVNGEIASVTGANNSGPGYTTSPFNTIGVISNVTGSTFDITGFASGFPLPLAAETATAIVSGNTFTIDPGASTVGTNTSPIYGDAGASSASTGVFVVGGSSGTGTLTPGTRQGVVFFITDSGYETAPSPPIVFTVPANTTSISVTNIPVGPPNVKARGIAFTEAGQNGIPGENFYVIPNPVRVQVLNGAPVTYTSTIVDDNTTTSAVFTFIDSVLLSSTEIDVQGNDLFNLIELGSSAWCVPYAGRMFYGLQLNKIDNFLNLTFDGGYIPNPNPGSLLFPLGWTRQDTNNDVTLLDSPVTGMALYVFNNTGSTLASAGGMYQTAYQDAYQVPIILPNTLYSIRVTCSCPSGVQVGVLNVALAEFTNSTGYAPAVAGFPIPLSSMTSSMKVFTGTFLTTPFTRILPPNTSAVPADLVLAVNVVNLGPGADVLIDRIEIFPTLEPYLLYQVYGSYVDDLEAIDASGSGGIVDTSEENPQSCMGGFVMHDTLYLLKTDSMVSTEDNPNSEPGGWGVREVSNRVGTIGINAYDTGEEWAVTACRAGIYGFNGGQPVPISREIWNLWNCINWAAGNTIWLRNDIVNKRILCGIPLPTGTSPEGVPTKTVQWLPYAPYNPAPTSPNVVLMMNYQGLDTFESLVSSPGLHVTMFGSLSDRDMTRKWSIWQIPSPYADFISRQDVEDKPLFVCNGINSEKIYEFKDEQHSDDGAVINSLYTTYGHVNAAKAATLPIFGFHAKRYTVLQGTAYGQGNMQIRVLQNTLDARYPWTIPGGINLSPVMNDDWMRPLNIRAQRAFLEFSTNAVGAWFNLSKTLLSGKADNYNLNPTGGGNNGITT